AGQYLYKPSQVQRIREIPELHDGRITRGNQTLMTVSKACEEHGWLKPFLYRMLDSASPWLGRPVKPLRILVRDEGALRRWRYYRMCDEALIRKIAEAQAEGRSYPAERWPSRQEVIEGKELSERWLKRLCREGKIKTRPGLRVKEDGFVAEVVEC